MLDGQYICIILSRGYKNHLYTGQKVKNSKVL